MQSVLPIWFIGFLYRKKGRNRVGPHLVQLYTTSSFLRIGFSPDAKERYKSQYREQSAASKLPFCSSQVTLISHTRTACEFNLTAAIKLLPQSSRDAAALSVKQIDRTIKMKQTYSEYYSVPTIQQRMKRRDQFSSITKELLTVQVARPVVIKD